MTSEKAVSDHAGGKDYICLMRMKKDAMLNGQLKPAYNLQHGVNSEYATSKKNPEKEPFSTEGLLKFAFLRKRNK